MTGPHASAHTSATLQIWRRLRDLRERKEALILDGGSLDVAAVIAVGRHGIKPTISKDPALAERLELSVNILATCLAKDWVIYGVNTGFGGSADTRKSELVDLQIHLLQFCQSAIITSADKDPSSNTEREPSHVMPLEWVRAAIVARANQNLRGHSAVRVSVLQSLVDLLHKDITPLVPLRGTISASGDLMPMAYIAGAVTGNPDIFVSVGTGREAAVMPAPEALRRTGLAASGIGQKEALGLINGTAPSVALASLVLYDTQRLAFLAQMLTAFAAESMGGNVEWALPFIHAARPHIGQMEAASNIVTFLHGSQLVTGLESRKRKGDGLWQDRYSTRTAPQWIGPYLEDLILSQRQIEVELNSTSDNPLVDASEVKDAADGEVYSGGNFQAVAVTSAMDKARLALQMIGRMLYSQVTEIINPATNNGLEANLNVGVRDDFTMKGIDINLSAYMSELAALSHPVSAHVMSAEMHNQGINSLALLSARRTMEAVDLVAHICACHLYVSCQAVDLRASHVQFLKTFIKRLVEDQSSGGLLHGLGLKASLQAKLAEQLSPSIEAGWGMSSASSWEQRICNVVGRILTPVTAFLIAEGIECSTSQLHAFRVRFQTEMHGIAKRVFYPGTKIAPSTVVTQLGDGTAQLYTWVRAKLGVPLHCGIDDDPLYNAHLGRPTDNKKTMGSWVSIVYESILKGGLMDMVFDGMETRRRAPRTIEAFQQLCVEMKSRF